MFWSAVSLCLICSSPDQVGRLSEREHQIWRRIEPSIVTVMEGAEPTGPAALIDSSGLFLACRSAILDNDMLGRTFDGQVIHLHVRGVDPITQFVLLQASDWASTASPLSAPDTAETPGGAILAVLTNGPIRAEFVSSDRFGVLKPSRRLVPLNEYRFEAPAEAVGTALVVSETGQLLGALHATLATQADGVTPGSALTDSANPLNHLPTIIRPKFGPSEMTVAYSVGAPIMQRVINGFDSADHRVDYPTLGVICSDAVGGGALVQQVVKSSPAEKAGMRVGDVMLDIGGHAVRNQIDFARIMLGLAIGKATVIRIKRDDTAILLNVVIAKSG